MTWGCGPTSPARQVRFLLLGDFRQLPAVQDAFGGAPVLRMLEFPLSRPNGELTRAGQLPPHQDPREAPAPHAALPRHHHASCQGLTLRGRVHLCDTSSPHFSKTLSPLALGEGPKFSTRRPAPRSSRFPPLHELTENQRSDQKIFPFLVAAGGRGGAGGAAGCSADTCLVISHAHRIAIYEQEKGSGAGRRCAGAGTKLAKGSFVEVWEGGAAASPGRSSSL